jgi:hexosaminidase
LKVNDPALEIRYTSDGKPPSPNAPKYVSPIPITKTTTLRAAVFNKTKPLGKAMSVQYTIHKAIGKSYVMPRKPEQYTGGDEFGLTNGVTGGIKTWNHWVGLVNHDIDPVIDFGQATAFGKVSFNFVNAKASWIWPPKAAEVYISDDGINFKLLISKTIDAEALMAQRWKTWCSKHPMPKGVTSNSWQKPTESSPKTSLAQPTEPGFLWMRWW